MRAIEQNTKPKTSSIIRKINRSIQFHRLAKMIFWDLFFGSCMVFGCCLAMETQHGIPFYDKERIFSYQHFDKVWQTIQSWQYTVVYDAKTITIEVGMVCFIVMLLVGSVFVIQLLGWLFAWSTQNHKLRKYMRPIDELAIAADKNFICIHYFFNCISNYR